MAAGPDLHFHTTHGDFSVSLTSLLTSQLDTDLRMLNSGNGVRLGVIRMTDRNGQSEEIDLSTARTVRDVLNAINAADLSVSATVVGVGDKSIFQIMDTSGVSEDDPNAAKLKIRPKTR